MPQAGKVQPWDREGRALGCQKPKGLDHAWTCHLPRPAIFAIEDSLLDGHFVLATLSELDSHPQTLHAQEELQRPEPQLQAHR